MTVAIKGNASIAPVILCRCAINERAIRLTQSHVLFVYRLCRFKQRRRNVAVCVRDALECFALVEMFFFSASDLFFFFLVSIGVTDGGGSEHKIVLHREAAPPTCDRAV